MDKFVALFDLHYGFERKGGHKLALHDPKALSVALQFIEDFEPDHVILGGDMLDCGAISHHHKNKPGQLEGLRLLADATELRSKLIKPLEDQIDGRLVYHVGNHEDWLNDLVDDLPALEGIVDVRALLKLAPQWEVIPQGQASRLGKLTFIHGDQITSTESCAKNAVIAYEKNVRFGHFHTFQTYAKNSPLDAKLAKTGMAVPCLCRKDPGYGQGKPNKWVQGFLFGYVGQGGNFNDYVAVIVDGRAMIQGKEYKG